MKYLWYYKTNLIGDMTIAEENGYITNIEFGRKKLKNGKEKETEIIKQAYRQLEEYLNGKRKNFDLKLNPEGTDFRKKVWNALTTIPYGETRTYQDIAIAIGNPKASRAVGNANHNNPISIFIPCHRVIGTNGKLVGYEGGLDKKIKLLKIEGIEILE